MSDLDFQWDWLDGTGMAPVEFGRTFAALSIRVDGRLACRIEDLAAETVRSVLHVPLYPLAEWIVCNWWSLLHEEPAPEATGFASRHCFASAADGFAYPPLWLAAEGPSVRVNWRVREAPGAGVRFPDAGDSLLDRETVANALADFVQSVCERLDATGIEETYLQREWDTFRRLEDEERRWCAVAGALGVDPFDPNGFDSDLLERAWKELPRPVFEELVSACSAPIFAEHLDWLRCGLSALGPAPAIERCAPPFPRERLGQDAPEPEGSGDPPHETGCRWAREVRDLCGLTVAQPVDPRQVWSEVYEDAKVDLREAPTRASRIDGLLGIGDSGRMAFYYGPRRGRGERFLLARAIGEGLLGCTSGAFTRLVSPSRTSEQKFNRAFAAELLAPAAFLKQQCVGNRASEEDVTELADVFNVSEWVVRHQLENRGVTVGDQP